MNNQFDYQTAFSRNIGWVTSAEQENLRSKRIAIAGMGGVGGIHLLTLARLGIGSFNISDMDVFEVANFNRQTGASMRTLGRAKVEVMEEMALDINPQLNITQFPVGLTEGHLDEFLNDVDLYVDSLDFFAVKIRREMFDACAKKGIPAITAAPLGMGVAFLCFMPGKMTFEDYFCLDGQSELEQLLRFFVALAPSGLQMSYLVDSTTLDLDARKGPSTPMACDLCAGMAGTYALKILLNRSDILAAPWGLHFDAYKNRLKRTWLPGGNRNPLQRLKLMTARKNMFSTKTAAH